MVMASLWTGGASVNARESDEPEEEFNGWSEPTNSTGGGAHAARGREDDARSPTAVGQQLLAEQLQRLAQAIVHEHGHLSHERLQMLTRMVRFAQELKKLHAIDRKGRCRLCRSRSHWWQRPQPCDVHARLVELFGEG